MEPGILKTVGQLAGIGGIALGVFLLLFREFIRKNIFPSLSRSQAYSLLRLFLILVWTVAIFGISAWLYANSHYTRPVQERGVIKVDDIIISNKGYTALVDFRVRNEGGTSVSINRVRLRVLTVEDSFTEEALEFSAKYDLDISNLEKVGDTVEVPVSHRFSPGEIDRFALTLMAKNLKPGAFRRWTLEPTLMTSEGEVQANPFVVMLPWDRKR